MWQQNSPRHPRKNTSKAGIFSGLVGIVVLVIGLAYLSMSAMLLLLNSPIKLRNKRKLKYGGGRQG